MSHKGSRGALASFDYSKANVSMGSILYDLGNVDNMNDYAVEIFLTHLIDAIDSQDTKDLIKDVIKKILDKNKKI